MLGKILGRSMGFAVLMFMSAVMATQWRDIMRYAKIRRLSLGSGHPEKVPVRGKAAYPHR